MVAACFKLSCHMPGETDKNHEQPQPRKSETWLKIRHMYLLNTNPLCCHCKNLFGLEILPRLLATHQNLDMTNRIWKGNLSHTHYCLLRSGGTFAWQQPAHRTTAAKPAHRTTAPTACTSYDSQDVSKVIGKEG
jgi:hypothetical protein